MPFHSTNHQIHLPSTLRLLVSYLRVFRLRQPSFALLQVLLTGNVTLTGLLGRFDRSPASLPSRPTHPHIHLLPHPPLVLVHSLHTSPGVWSSRCSATAGTPQVQGGVFCRLVVQPGCVLRLKLEHSFVSKSPISAVPHNVRPE